VTLSSEAANRYLPSVDRLESAMRAARRALERGDLEGALRENEVAIQLKPDYDAAWLLRGHIFRKDGNIPGAIEAFAAALKRNGESEEGWLGLATALHDVGRFDEEVEAYDRLLDLHPQSVEAWINKGALLHERQDYRGAIACYDKVLAMRPEHAGAWNNKGAALLRLGDESGAARCIDEALLLNPDFYDALANRAVLAWTAKRPGEAVLWADRALRIREAAWLWVVKGQAHLSLDESTLGMKAFERALALDPRSRAAHTGLEKAKAQRSKSDFYRGVYECFGTFVAGDPGCGECEIRARCTQVTP
jgi:tetratricopeptide (TPR) repeat protein